MVRLRAGLASACMGWVRSKRAKDDKRDVVDVMLARRSLTHGSFAKY
jgi:hypothetical protein